MEAFKKYYCIDNTFVGKSVKTVKLLYPVYCKLFNVKQVDDIIKEICKRDNLILENNKFIACQL